MHEELISWARTRRILLLALVAILSLAQVLAVTQGTVFADYPRVLQRSLRIGTTAPGAVTDYTFSWRWPTATSVGSVRLLLCADAYVADPCSSTPAGDFSGAVLSAQTGALGGFGIATATANEIILSRGAAGSSGTGQYSFEFDNIMNPTGLHHRFFVQIFSYSSTNASGTPTHMAAVANATTEPIMVTSIVPPILYFCTGLTITPWCANAVGNSIDYGDLLDPSDNYGTSQFGVATNAEGGYVVTVNGNTMAAGNKLIDALSTQTARTPGEAQFGLNLRANTDPAVGADVGGLGTGTVAADYDTPDLFKYTDGDVVASAITGTLFDTFTVTYIVNVPPDQPSGIYTTTITYICTAAF